MGDPPGQCPQGFHLLGLIKLGLQFFAGADIPEVRYSEGFPAILIGTPGHKTVKRSPLFANTDTFKLKISA